MKIKQEMCPNYTFLYKRVLEDINNQDINNLLYLALIDSL